ncbi:glycoside hydrolase family 36 protein [Isoptericola sp. AK164]|uniref:glycoside hydrolase family 36 protein n=1 Tax=Isoptericola sp. AK164 TaxID=3024246 RepID=UPI0024189BFF|nr:glycoside hydrolase family 36 protein [Isoptericola sp. AK164]
MDSTTHDRTTLPLWERGAHLEVSWSDDSPVTAYVGHAAEDAAGRHVQPLVEILAVGHGHAHANLRHTATAVGARLRYVDHEVGTGAGRRVVTVRQRDEVTGLEVTSHLVLPDGRTSLQAWTTVHHGGEEEIVLQAVSSLVVGDPVGAGPVADVQVVEGSSEWLAESRWTTRGLRDQGMLAEAHLAVHQQQDARGSHAVVGRGAWSSGERVPAGALASRTSGLGLAWQVEHNGPWRAEIAERLTAAGDGTVSLGLFGPTDTDHAWSRVLRPGETFTSVPVSISAVVGGWQDAVAEMTRHRRHLRSAPRAGGAIVFNDYMNTLMGDPTTEKLLPLIDAAAAVGADYFCVDAGWYDDDGDWWDSVGLWEPSRARFRDGGLDRVLDHVRSAGMVPGLWLEPEVVGVRSPLADSLPHEAFLQRRGTRVVEQGRYLLDLRHESSRKHLDAVVDRLVDDMGVGYLKLDYNVTPGVGTDRAADSPGDGLLQHALAYQSWLDGVLRRHPDLVVENCASGGLRADFAMLSRLELQSTSDQQDPLLYPPIAAGALVSILPEQAASWAYPQPDMSAEEIAFTMITGISGRLYLSGRLDQMDAAQRRLVREGVEAARSWDDADLDGAPFWPIGLPSWEDDWVAVGKASATHSRIALWARSGSATTIDLTVPEGTVEILYPRAATDDWEVSEIAPGRLRVRPGAARPGARLLQITHPTG